MSYHGKVVNRFNETKPIWTKIDAFPVGVPDDRVLPDKWMVTCPEGYDLHPVKGGFGYGYLTFPSPNDDYFCRANSPTDGRF